MISLTPLDHKPIITHSRAGGDRITALESRERVATGTSRAPYIPPAPYRGQRMNDSEKQWHEFIKWADAQGLRTKSHCTPRSSYFDSDETHAEWIGWQEGKINQDSVYHPQRRAFDEWAREHLAACDQAAKAMAWLAYVAGFESGQNQCCD